MLPSHQKWKTVSCHFSDCQQIPLADAHVVLPYVVGSSLGVSHARFEGLSHFLWDIFYLDASLFFGGKLMQLQALFGAGPRHVFQVCLD